MGIQENLKAVFTRIEEEHLIQDCENLSPPVMKDGAHLDHRFVEQLKHVWRGKDKELSVEHPEFFQMSPEQRAEFLEANRQYIDWGKTKALRELIYRGYEAQKTAKPGRVLAPVPEEEILAAIESIANPKSKEIVDNRFVHE